MLRFRKKTLLKTGSFGELVLSEREVMKAKFKEEIPIFEDTPLRPEIGKAVNIRYIPANKSIVCDLVFSRRPYYLAYKPGLEIKITKRGREIKIKSVINAKVGNFTIRYRRMTKNIRKYRRDIY